MRYIFIFFLLIFTSLNIYGQYVDGNQIRYGNEWIDYNERYVKVIIEEDGLYRLSRNQLEDAGFDINSVPMSEFAMYHLGEEIPITTTSEGIMSSNDYIEFYGLKNRSEIDKYYFQSESQILNPEFSLITDRSSYFLVKQSGENLRNTVYETNLSGNLPPLEKYYMHKIENIYAASNGFSKPQSTSSEVKFSTGVDVEGFGTPLSKNQSQSFSLSKIADNSVPGNISLRFGTNKPQHEIQLKNSGNVLKQYSFIGYDVISDNISLQHSELKSNVSLALSGTYSNSDRFYLAELSLSYPREFDFNGINTVKFEFEGSPFDRYFELENLDFDNEVLIYDLKNNRKIIPVSEAGVVKYLSPANNSGNTFMIASDNAIKEPVSISGIDFTNFSKSETEYLIISHEDLFDDGTGTNLVQEYANYRASIEGGGYNSRVVEVQEIYDQFGYGVENHFLAVKSFINYCVENWDNFESVFLIGKGREYGAYRFDNQKENDPFFHIPTFGHPGSDNTLASKWGETTPQVAIGRLACRTTDELRAYFIKAVEHDLQIKNAQTIEGKLWMKKILHLSGGDPTIQEYIKNYLKNMENILESSKLGADVTTYYKQNSDPIENVQSQELIKLIDNGLSLITFFGHSAIGVFDLNLENVEKYNNKGKYPVMLSLGCHSGNVHSSANGLSQQFVLANNKGAIAFIAASSEAYIPNQGNLGSEFCNFFGKDSYGQPIGEIIKSTLQSFETLPAPASETLLQQFTLHGDPVIRMHPAPSEDYLPEYASIKIQPEVINAYQDSFQVCFNVVNIGTSSPKNFDIRVEHIGPQGEINADTIINRITPVFREEYCLKIPLKFNNLVGKNSLKITTDYTQQIIELPPPDAENNNSLDNGMGGDTYDFFILNNGAVPVAPKNYSIFTQDEVVLQASSFNALGNKQTFLVQIDTTENFNSPLLLAQSLDNVTGLISWKPQLDFIPGTVYYWRISPEDNPNGPGLIWENSSFLYLPNSSPGWNQSHVYQFEDNSFDELQLEDRKLEYVADYRDIRVLNRVSQGQDFANLFISGIFIGNAYLVNKGYLLGCTVFDSLGNIRLNPPEGLGGSFNPAPGQGNIVGHYFKPKDQESRIAFVDFVDTVLNDGDYVYFYSVFPKNGFSDGFQTETWAADSIVNDGKNIFNVLEAQGASIINDFRNESMVPYNFFFRKNKGALQEGRADDIYGSTDNTAALFGRWYTGTEKSVTIGPSNKWRKLVWRDDPKTVSETDSSYVRLYGIKNDGTESLIYDKILEKEINLAPINADTFPNIKLEYYTFDNIDKTSPNLLFWRVFFDGDAELALDILDEDAEFHADTIEQGDDFRLILPLKNIGMVDVDSINVRLTLTDENNNATVVYKTLAPIEIGGKSVIEYIVNTSNFFGEYSVSVEANYIRSPKECFYFNNFGLRKFYVRGDLRNPLLDVSFDGRRIMNGDLVSAEPIIRIVTKDENRHLLMNDTSTYKIWIIDPVGVETEIPIGDPRITFIPSNSIDDNKNEIIFTPAFEVDGIYTLKVRSEDMTGNLSGDNDYVIDFEIINEELISNVLNYPNPFSDCTQFIFTLTGNETPQDISIKIMTVSGRVVKEISGLELGPLHIGVNRTEYKWDGTDEFGSKLANGVYLYQVVTRNQNGEIYDKYDVGTDRFFHKNIGKLVILR